MAKIPKYLLNLAGEYRVCSELNRHGVFATVTYGNRKSVDVYAISEGQERERALKIEVKTTQGNKFVTNLAQKYAKTCDLDSPGFWKRVAAEKHAPDFWVLVQMLPNEEDRFFVLTHREVCAIQEKRNKDYASTHSAVNFAKGVDNIRLTDIPSPQRYENKWERITVLVPTAADALPKS